MDVRGVDFSGGAEPGTDIWITEGRLDGSVLELEACRPAIEAFGVRERAPVLGSLRDLLAESSGATGIDCSFGLPAAVLPAAVSTWHESVAWVADAFADADAAGMRDSLKQRARSLAGDGVELKRRTDDAVGANSPYSFITYYQTLHGVRDLLAPLLDRGAVAVPPMDPAGERTVLEVYPAGTLRRLGAPDVRYKEGADGARKRREQIVETLAEAIPTRVPEVVHRRALDDPGGDALDSVLAAVATARAAASGFEPQHDYRQREGHIYA